MTITKKQALETLTKARLLEVADELDLPGLTRKHKDEVVEEVVSSRAATLPELLALFSRAELKTACEAVGLSTKGREKAVIVERLLGAAPPPAPAQPTKTKSPAKKSMTNNNASLGFEQELWKTADLLRNNMDPAEYKHVVLGLLFLKYIEDSFEERRSELVFAVSDPSSEYYVPDEADREPEIAGLLEDPDEYLAENVFWVPEEARWTYIRSKAKQPEIGKIVDAAMDAIERDNTSLKGVLPKVYALPNLDKTNLGKLIDIVSGIGLGSKEHKDKDTLGRVYEYFLSRFASTEGRGGGEFYTPTSVVRLLVEMLEPYEGRVYDPCCGSGGMFVQSLKFIDAHGGKRDKVTVYGQESNFTTWRMARMNLAIRGIDGKLGPKQADSFHEDLHPDLRADFILANPPFNVSAWGGERLQGDLRWQHGTPPKGNANFAWVQHFIHHLGPNGVAGFVLSNISLAAENRTERSIRASIIEADLVDCIVRLPDRLFYSTPIPACFWILRKNKNPGGSKADRRGEILFIDAAELGTEESRTHSVISNSATEAISQCYKNWKSGSNYEDNPGFCRSVGVAEVSAKNNALLPPLFVGLNASRSATDAAEFTGAVEEGVQSIAVLSSRVSLAADSAVAALSGLCPEGKPFLEGQLQRVKIRDVLEPCNERLGQREEPPILSVTERAGLMLQSERFSKRIATADTAKYKLVRQTDIVYNPYLLWAGAIDQCWVVTLGITSPAYEVLRVRAGWDPSLIGYAITRPFMIRVYDGISIGTVKRRRRAPVESLLELEVLVPSKSEQERFAAASSALRESAQAAKALADESKGRLQEVCRAWYNERHIEPYVVFDDDESEADE